MLQKAGILEHTITCICSVQGSHLPVILKWMHSGVACISVYGACDNINHTCLETKVSVGKLTRAQHSIQTVANNFRRYTITKEAQLSLPWTQWAHSFLIFVQVSASIGTNKNCCSHPMMGASVGFLVLAFQTPHLRRIHRSIPPKYPTHKKKENSGIGTANPLCRSIPPKDPPNLRIKKEKRGEWNRKPPWSDSWRMDFYAFHQRIHPI